MKRLIAAALAVAALTLGGCASLGAITAATVKDELAVYVAEAAYKGERILADKALDAGQIKCARAAQGAGFVGRSYTAVTTVRAAYAIASADTVQGQSLAALAVLMDLQSIIAGRDLPAASGPAPPTITGLSLITTAANAAPELSLLAAEAQTVMRSTDPAFIRERSAALAGENDVATPPLITRLQSAATGC
jgi:hypothetical protein